MANAVPEDDQFSAPASTANFEFSALFFLLFYLLNTEGLVVSCAALDINKVTFKNFCAILVVLLALV